MKKVLKCFSCILIGLLTITIAVAILVCIISMLIMNSALLKMFLLCITLGIVAFGFLLSCWLIGNLYTGKLSEEEKELRAKRNKSEEISVFLKEQAKICYNNSTLTDSYAVNKAEVYTLNEVRSIKTSDGNRFIRDVHVHTTIEFINQSGCSDLADITYVIYNMDSLDPKIYKRRVYNYAEEDGTEGVKFINEFLTNYRMVLAEYYEAVSKPQGE